MQRHTASGNARGWFCASGVGYNKPQRQPHISVAFARSRRPHYFVIVAGPPVEWEECVNFVAMCQCAPPASRSCLPRRRPSTLARVLFRRCGYRRCLSPSRSRFRRRVYARVRVFAASISFARRERAAGLFDNRSASILIQTATKTIPTTRRSHKITPIAVPSTVPEKCTVLVVLSGNVFLKIPGANYHHLPFVPNSWVADLLS